MRSRQTVDHCHALVFSILSVTLVACGTGERTARSAFSAEFKCPYDATHLREVDNYFIVTGCEEKATYRCWPRWGQTRAMCRRTDINAIDTKEDWGPTPSVPPSTSSRAR